MQDGIYDIPSLIAEYPSYRSFVEPAFVGDKAHTAELSDVDVYSAISSRSWILPEHAREGFELRFYHSAQDELLSFEQTCVAVQQVTDAVAQGNFDVHDADIPAPTSSVPDDESCACWYSGTAGDASAQIASRYGNRLRDLPPWVHVDFGNIRVRRGRALTRLTL